MMRLILLICVFSSCSDDRESPAREFDFDIDVGYSALRISLPIFVARERGYFRHHGLNVRLRRYETAQPLVEEVLDGRLDAGGFAALPIIMTAVTRGDSEVRLSTAMIEDVEHPVSYLLRHGDSELRSIADLAGKRIGILPTIAYRRWIDAVLRGANVDPDTTTILPIAPAQQIQALSLDGADALFTNDPMATAALAAGAEHLDEIAPVPRALGGPFVFGSFLVHPELVRTRPEAVRRLLRALDDAIVAIGSDQDAARRAMREYVREPERPHVEKYPAARYLPSNEFDDEDLAREIAAMAELGILQTRPVTSGWTLAAP